MWAASRRGFSIALMICALLTATSALAEPARTVKTQKVDVEVETVATGLEHPWAVEVLPDGAYLVTERPGRMRLVRDGKALAPISGVPEVYARGQGGLLDVALDPKFPSNRTLYFTASVAGDGGNGTAIFRARLSPDETRLTDVKRIFLMNKLSRGNIQYGSRIAIARDGSLFVSLGDRGQQTAPRIFRTMPAPLSISKPMAAFPPTIRSRTAKALCRKSGRRAIATHRASLSTARRTGSTLQSTAPEAAMRSTRPKLARTMVGQLFPTASITTARRSASARQSPVWSSPVSIGIHRSPRAPLSSTTAKCFLNGTAISSSRH